MDADLFSSASLLADASLLAFFILNVIVSQTATHSARSVLWVD